ncbi:transporter substrate-binding domain-containing protein [Aureimonas fodinaquatilis]|uniref:Transporter substrate-binding domain-containing protein n=1 Tax=Aureimonas fodinaquatilis TaxID=2565783 RepID=A0A5B0DWD8_9HYPH|nr:lysine/arginine/ornithine ABC transporter substrate-binding protein [Aureimonas fodinaquatilis]KAA0970185.1 transporter substrate-binding domain-containing protein [Aureimonas fodinaquatilis]
MRLFLRLVSAVATFALVAGVASAQKSDADKTWTEVRIGTEGAYPPFNFLNSAGQLEGFDIDIAKALCDEMKVTCTFVTSDWDGIIPALQNGRFDAIVASMSITPERSQQVLFTNKYYNTGGAVAVPKDSDLTEATAETLAGKTIGAQGGTTHSTAAETYFPDADVRVYPTAEEYKLDIENGRVDAVVDDIVVLSDWINSDAGACCKIIGQLEAKPEIYGPGIGIALRQGNEQLKTKFDEAILAIRENGTYQKVQDKYFDFDVYGE